MAKWHYYNENGEKIGPIRGRDLTRLVREGTVTQNTRVEDENGRVALAKNVTGLPFHETTNPDTLSSETSSVMLSPPAEVNPFTASMPATANPFAAPMPVAINPFTTSLSENYTAIPQSVHVPIVEEPRRSFGEMVASAAKSLMNFLASIVAFVLVLLLCVFVAWLLWWLWSVTQDPPREREVDRVPPATIPSDEQANTPPPSKRPTTNAVPIHPDNDGPVIVPRPARRTPSVQREQVIRQLGQPPARTQTPNRPTQSR